MRCLLVLSLVLACVYARETAIRVKWGIPLVNSDIFIKIPRDVADIKEDGWVQIERPAGSFLPSLTMYCVSGDLTFGALFDTAGVLAGLQIALSKKILTDIPYEMTAVGFTTWVAPDGDEYWVTQQYFVSAETEAAGITVKATETLREGAVWVVGKDGSLMRLGATVEDMDKSTVYVKQSCIPSMGQHYFYDLYREKPKDDLYPWFTLFHNNRMTGTGVMVAGNYSGPAEGKRMWFEQPPQSAVKVIVKNGPQWAYDLVASPGVISMHIFYGDRYPPTILCPLW